MSRRHPAWIRARAPAGKAFEEVRSLVESAGLHTVCQSARCPNIGECWRERTATFMILGGVCTRNCRFCAVSHGSAGPVDLDEPRRVADAMARLGLRHAVITSVTRDDLPDGGAAVFAETIRLIHSRLPGCSVEVLIPDFQGSRDSLGAVLEARPEILNHNIETVERLYPAVRPQADYARSVALLRDAKVMRPDIRTKSGLMVGLGESRDELVAAMSDLRSAGCDILTIGQYLAPSHNHAAIERYYTPEEFDELRSVGLGMGFGYVESGPMVRSSYHAAEQAQC